MASRLCDATKLELVSGDAEGSVWRGLVTDAYNVFVVPNGGLLMAMVLRALRNEQERHGVEKESNVNCLLMQTTFFSSTAGNSPCEIVVQVIKRGRKISWLRGDLRQSGKTRLSATAAFGKYDVSPAANIVPFEDVSAMNFESERWKTSVVAKPAGTERVLFHRYTWRFPPRDADIFLRMVAEKDMPGQCPTNFFVYMQHEDAQEPITAESLAAIADAAIPTVKGLLPFGDSNWVPTLTFDMHIFAEPRPELKWVFCEFNLEATSKGRCIQGVSMYDPETGALLCRASQGALNEAKQQNKSNL
mmetsp:Transcript_16166/g.31261  ORF Transcript_16166/g.31261 Transcript_16166/m.31261 type:complete len:303 (+) Transcript_16166:53-961(+)